MSGPIDADLLALRSVSDHWRTLLDDVGDEQWSSPSPCDGWDLQALIDHVVGGNWFTSALLDGRTADQAMAETIGRFDEGSATTATALDSFSEQLGAFEQDDVLDQQWNHVAGDLSGSQMIRLRLHDLLVHAWDVQQSLGSSRSLPEELTRWGFAELGRADSLAVDHFGATPDAGDAKLDAATTYVRLFRSVP